MNALAVDDAVVVRPINVRRALALVFTLPLILAADFLIFDRPVGWGWMLWVSGLWGFLAVTRWQPAWRWRTKDVFLLVLMASSLAQCAWRPSLSNSLVLVCLTAYAAAHFELRNVGPWWERFLAGVRAVGAGPLRWVQSAGAVAGLADRVTRRAIEPDTVGNLRNFLIIFGPAFAIGVVFLVLLGSGNAVLGVAISTAVQRFFDALWAFDVPGPGRVVFWASLGTVVIGLLWPLGAGVVRQSILGRGMEAGTFPAPRLVDVAAWSTRMMLLSVNVVFFAANTIDVVHLWRESVLPAGLTLSEFVHKGTWNLVASVVVAALALCVIFHQNERVVRRRGIAVLALVWIGQNLLLLSNVGLRLKLYVDSFGMSILRVHLALFLFLVAVGFVLLAIRVVQRRKLKWLFGANLLATFLLFFGVQFWDTRAFVADLNTRQDQVEELGLDVPFLVELGPSGWEALKRVAEAEMGTAAHPYREAALTARQKLANAEKWREQRYGWRSLQGERLLRTRALPGF
ncbi:MAG: DUF4153 domain-containing protein [Verrucomicrobiota bacterium]